MRLIADHNGMRVKEEGRRRKEAMEAESKPMDPNAQNLQWKDGMNGIKNVVNGRCPSDSGTVGGFEARNRLWRDDDIALGLIGHVPWKLKNRVFMGRCG